MNSFVSIIVPCYNQAQYLDECLQSVLEQTYENWECIIVNDGSPDDTEQVAKKWLEKDARFKYIYKENGGLSSARNAGIKIAKGDFIQLLDSDDLLENDKLKIQIKAFSDDADIDISVSGYRYFENGFTELKILGRDNFLPENGIMKNDSDIIELLRLKNPMVISAPLYKKNVFDVIGLFDENLFSLEDWDFHTRCAVHKMKFQHVGYQANSFTLIRLHNESMMRNKEEMNKSIIIFKQKQNKRINPLRYSIKFIIKLFIPPIFFLLISKFKQIFNG